MTKHQEVSAWIAINMFPEGNVAGTEKILVRYGSRNASFDMMKKMDSCGVMEESDFNHYNFRR